VSVGRFYLTHPGSRSPGRQVGPRGSGKEVTTYVEGGLGERLPPSVDIPPPGRISLREGDATEIWRVLLVSPVVSGI
jgi:hypothetical protein